MVKVLYIFVMYIMLYVHSMYVIYLQHVPVTIVCVLWVTSLQK